MKIQTALLLTLALAAPVAAQTRRPIPRPSPSSTEPPISLRAFGMIAEQQFSAQTTFDAVFGQTAEPFWGGGADVVFRHGIYVEVGASRFKKTGQRAFRSNGQTFKLGIPLTATVTPFEVTGGYRFRFRRHPSVIPYVGGGVGSYAYTETSSFSDSSENVDTRHVGGLVVGGVEFRVHRWVGLGVDAHYTHIPGILGVGGISKDANESDLGGVAARFKVIVGR
jgi:outer membrane protein W